MASHFRFAGRFVWEMKFEIENDSNFSEMDQIFPSSKQL